MEIEKIKADEWPESGTLEFLDENGQLRDWKTGSPATDRELLFSGGAGLPCQLQHEIHEPHGLCRGISG
jgi:hypothetical protein